MTREPDHNVRVDSLASNARWSRRHWLAASSAWLVPSVQASSAYEWRRWDTQRVVPRLDLAHADGSRWRLADQRGHVVVANFWATWCEPCRDEMPSLARLAEREAARGLRVVAINYREPAAKAERFMAGLGLKLPVLLDTDGEAAVAWTPRIFPSTVLIGRRGRPAGVLVGEIDWTGDAATALLAPLLAG